jgi:hypothetical protein
MKLKTAAPKPRRKPVSAPRGMKRSALKPKKRSASEFRRIYGSKARMLWVKSQRCAWCVMRGHLHDCGPVDNAHTENEGLSRKGHYTTIVPLGRPHHQKYDRYEHPFSSPASRLAVKYLAEETERRWQLYAEYHSNRDTK